MSWNSLFWSRSFLILSLLTFSGLNALFAQHRSHAPVYVDTQGTIRWSDSNKEADFFGANYCLYSSSDFRAAGYLHADRKAMIREDLEQFARMGWNALRLSFWGDFENSDTAGNLVDNVHLDLMDYTIFQAQQRGIYLLLSPIVTYNSLWPDALNDTASVRGFSTKYPKSVLGTNLQARVVQERYLKQLLDHRNPYTGNLIKNEPNMLFVEMINEPVHHAKDLKGSIQYINSLIHAVRSTGARQILFHNLSQDFAIAPALNKSDIQGVSVGWYPSGLNSGHELQGNFLPAVDHYTPLLKPILDKRLARIVYEFETPDLLTGYLYPAMARSFREAGIQWASMFAYDMLETAPYNLGWQTHFLNLVYTPKKAVSAIIAAEAMRNLPRFEGYGNYPEDTSFGAFRVSYSRDLAEWLSDSSYMYDNATEDGPPHVPDLKHIVGYGSSPIVHYVGKGAYFLDKIRTGVWRLEVYPDAYHVRDPFEMPRPGNIVVESWHRYWPMSVHLPDLGGDFKAIPIDSGNRYHPKVVGGQFTVYPGVYILTSVPHFKLESLPTTLGFMGMREFYCPRDKPSGYRVRLRTNRQQVAGVDKVIEVSVSGPEQPDSVNLYVQPLGTHWFAALPMTSAQRVSYIAHVPAYLSGPGFTAVQAVVYHHGKSWDFPSGDTLNPSDWDYAPLPSWEISWHPPGSRVSLLQVRKQAPYLAFSRIGDGIRYPLYKLVADSIQGKPALKLEFPSQLDTHLTDYTVRVPIGNLCAPRADLDSNEVEVAIRARGRSGAQEGWLTFIDSYGRCWAHLIPLTNQWHWYTFLLSSMKPSRGVNLPEGFPGNWDYWIPMQASLGGAPAKLVVSALQSMELSLRSEAGNEARPEPSMIEISDIDLAPLPARRN